MSLKVEFRQDVIFRFVEKDVSDTSGKRPDYVDPTTFNRSIKLTDTSVVVDYEQNGSRLTLLFEASAEKAGGKVSNTVLTEPIQSGQTSTSFPGVTVVGA